MENYGLRKSIFYCGKKEFEVINTCFQFFGFIRHLIVVYHLQMRVFVFVISYGCYGWQRESHHFFQRYVFYEKKKNKQKKKHGHVKTLACIASRFPVELFPEKWSESLNFLDELERKCLLRSLVSTRPVPQLLFRVDRTV